MLTDEEPRPSKKSENSTQNFGRGDQETESFKKGSEEFL